MPAFCGRGQEGRRPPRAPQPVCLAFGREDPPAARVARRVRARRRKPRRGDLPPLDRRHREPGPGRPTGRRRRSCPLRACLPICAGGPIRGARTVTSLRKFPVPPCGQVLDRRAAQGNQGISRWMEPFRRRPGLGRIHLFSGAGNEIGVRRRNCGDLPRGRVTRLRAAARLSPKRSRASSATVPARSIAVVASKAATATADAATQAARTIGNLPAGRFAAVAKCPSSGPNLRIPRPLPPGRHCSCCRQRRSRR